MPKQLLGILVWPPMMAAIWLILILAMIGFDMLTRPGFHVRALPHELNVRATSFARDLKYKRYVVTCPDGRPPFRVTVVDHDIDVVLDRAGDPDEPGDRAGRAAS